MRRKVLISLDPALLASLDRAAASAGKTVSALQAKAIRALLKSFGKPGTEVAK